MIFYWLDFLFFWEKKQQNYIRLIEKMHMERGSCCSVCIQRETRILTKLVTVLCWITVPYNTIQYTQQQQQHRKRNTKWEACTSERASMSTRTTCTACTHTHIESIVLVVRRCYVSVGWRERSVGRSCVYACVYSIAVLWRTNKANTLRVVVHVRQGQS